MLFMHCACMHLRHTLAMTFFSGKPESADGEEMETESHVDTQVSLIQPRACQFLLDYCFILWSSFSLEGTSR